MLLMASAVGGRRCSEVASLWHSQIRVVDLARRRPADHASQTMPCIRITLVRTEQPRQGRAPLSLPQGRCVTLQEWIPVATIVPEQILRVVCTDTSTGTTPLTQSTNLTLKMRCRMARLGPADLSADGLRSGFKTQAGRERIPLVGPVGQRAHKRVCRLPAATIGRACSESVETG
jgi:hypothetical protein